MGVIRTGLIGCVLLCSLALAEDDMPRPKAEGALSASFRNSFHSLYVNDRINGSSASFHSLISPGIALSWKLSDSESLNPTFLAEGSFLSIAPVSGKTLFDAKKPLFGVGVGMTGRPFQSDWTFGALAILQQTFFIRGLTNTELQMDRLFVPEIRLTVEKSLPLRKPWRLNLEAGVGGYVPISTSHYGTRLGYNLLGGIDGIYTWEEERMDFKFGARVERSFFQTQSTSYARYNIAVSAGVVWELSEE